MDIKILDVYEYKGILRVEVEHDYGKDNIGLSLDAQYLSEKDGRPKWKSEVEKLMKLKYANRKSDKSIPKIKMFKSDIGKKLKI